MLNNILDSVHSLQKKAVESGITFDVSCRTYQDTATDVINVNIKYTYSIGDITDMRSFTTSFSSDDPVLINNKKLAQLESMMEHTQYTMESIDNIAETEE